MQKRSNVWLATIALAGVLAGGAAGYLSVPSGPEDPRPKLAEATVLFGQERPVPEFALTAQDGSAFDRSSLMGRWTLLFFGYTHCPDVCPITMSALDTMLEHVEDEKVRNKVNVVFVSVDPARDTPQRLAEYVPFFNADFVGVTGTHDELRKLASALGAVYVLGKPQADGSYTVDHSSRLLLIGPDARFTAVMSDRTPPPVLAADLGIIVDAYDAGR